MQSYNVNVRAIIDATCIDQDASGEIPGWEIYDYSPSERDGTETATTFRIRCDQSVKVEAENEDAAIKLARENASLIVLEGFEIDNINIWVDKDIDVTMDEPTSIPSL